MARYIYKPTGAVCTAPDGKKMPPELFEKISDKPKPRRARNGAGKAVKAAEE